MRISPAALLADSREQMLENARRVTAITHNHPEGLKGALVTVDAIYALRRGAAPAEVRSFIELEYDYPLNRTVDMIRPDYDFDVSCQGSVPEAIICVLEATDFEDAIRNAVSLGGDSDTIYALRNLVERCFNKLKNSRRIATRYDKIALSFLGFINIASIRLWHKSLST